MVLSTHEMPENVPVSPRRPGLRLRTNPALCYTTTVKRLLLSVGLGMIGCSFVPPIGQLNDSRSLAPQEPSKAKRDRVVLTPSRRAKLAFVFPADKCLVNESDVAWGRKEVDKMMKARPAMATVVSKGDPLYEFVARRFGGGSCGRRIHWDPEPPPDGYPACNDFDSQACLSSLQVAAHDRLGAVSGQELWSSAIFELFNCENQDSWEKDRQALLRGKWLSREEYVWKEARLEFVAGLQLVRFFKQCWVPYQLNKGRTPSPEGWMLDEPTTFPEWKASCQADGPEYPYDSFGFEYDSCRDYVAKRERRGQIYFDSLTDMQSERQAMERRLNSKERTRQLAEITRLASERSFRESQSLLQAERNSAPPEPVEAPQRASSSSVAAPRMLIRAGEHPGENCYSNVDDSGLRAHH